MNWKNKMKKLVPIAVIALAACLPEDTQEDVMLMDGQKTTQYVDTSESTAESRLAKAALESLQAQSFSENTEFCGYIVRNAEGEMVISDIVQGEESSCLPPDVYEDDVILASFHTHGAFEIDTPAEFPSVGDVEGDEAEGIDGYVSTPGGRMWFVDGSETIVSQLCGVGCLSQDPNFVEGLDGDLALSYTLEQLRDLEMQ